MICVAVTAIKATPLWKTLEMKLGRPKDVGEIPLLKIIANGSKIYKIAKEFGECLAGTDLKISTNYLNCENQSIGIEFPTGVAFKTSVAGEFVSSAYVFLVDNSSHDFRLGARISGDPEKTENSSRRFNKLLMILLPIVDESGELTGVFNHLTLPLEFSDISACIEASLPSSEMPINANLVNFIVKCLVYIQSGDPDLREMRSEKQRLNARRWEVFRKKNSDASAFDVVYVGFDFKKPRSFSKDETVVRFHFRWQPYGPSRSKVKLIPIDEHVRHFNKKESEGA